MRRSSLTYSASPHRARALTMIELVIMLAIVAILAAAGIPRYGRSLALYRVQAAAARVAADINLARTRARTTSLGQSVVFDLTTNKYTLPSMTALAESASPYQVSMAKEPYAATLVSVDFASLATLTFDRYGQPSAAGTVKVQSSTMTATVIVDASSGIASVQ